MDGTGGRGDLVWDPSILGTEYTDRKIEFSDRVTTNILYDSFMNLLMYLLTYLLIYSL